MRLDVALVERGFARSRSQAQALIKAGAVSVNGQPIQKSSFVYESDMRLHVAQSDVTQYVSRGGIKLAGALDKLELDVKGLTAIDMGQSTGGFTDCLLQRDVAKVVGVDVGRDQLVQSVRVDPRVVCYEGINGRELPTQALLSHTANSQGFDLAVMDVSFISQTLIIPSLVPLLKKGAHLLSLVKPQFELQPEHIGKNGLVKTNQSYPFVELKIRECLASLGMQVQYYFPSDIEGGDGNKEFFIFARK
ncbi:TlyA family RNA methyltransferase [Simiduia aestuariiviva]|uniref:23S rRNA (Cytidine1920-2'-O)/16S rRNA (Cytidine1409-2'-O)-methyltransferase n=1 Tax=Simiduia aestuariiviva TaxID=1510459 RepID=A0A839UTR5_9GAMM|nr:TlyA family RNA methyltransferase [Simiduia aestuariiviva]MBB3169840.1 23S rRNA (cytidine1920-2'-O)/16S rRNA (cytidine1409-2'-O)-methyltransferase [Simiduia aestuariiviva]